MNLIELVPRDLNDLLKECQTIQNEFSFVDGFNIPDVYRLPTRSYKAASTLIKHQINVIPHIRAIDHPVSKTVDIVSKLVDEGLTQVLIVTGDLPAEPTKSVYDVCPLKVMAVLKSKHPTLKIYGALDPYRQSFQKELNYCHLKQSSGADGFFTQPFFDPELARIFLEQLNNCDIFLGISPVISEKSKNYWITRNKAIFPKGFSLDLADNCKVANQLMVLAKSFGQHTYHMPIKVSAMEYLRVLYEKQI